MAATKNTPDPAAVGNNPVPQPGTVVKPAASGQNLAEPIPAAPAPPPPPQPAAPPPSAPAPSPPPNDEPSEPEPEAASPADSDSEFNDDQGVTWTASEFVAHDKSTGWYLMLALGTLLLAALVFLTTSDRLSTGVVVIAGFLLGVYSTHQPRQLEYQVNRRGIGVGGRYHAYDEFRSFSVVEEGAFAGIVFMPLKRFAVPITIYCAPADEDRILDLLSDRLPFEEHQIDIIDSFLKRIRF